MSKSNRAFAWCFRWFMAGFFTFLIVLPAMISLGVI